MKCSTRLANTRADERMKARLPLGVIKGLNTEVVFAAGIGVVMQPCHAKRWEFFTSVNVGCNFLPAKKKSE